MNDLPYIDFHTHRYPFPPGTAGIYHVFPGQPLPPAGWFSTGIHPWYVKKELPHWEEVKQNAARPRCLAVGECGLDRLPRFRETYDLQQEIFRRHIELSEALRKPLIIHCVRCYDDLLRFRRGAVQPWILHGFAKGENVARRLIEKGIYLSFGKILLNPGSKAAMAFRNLPWEHVLLETDDAPLPVRRVYEAAARLKNTAVEEVKKKMAENFEKIFQKSVFSP